MTGGEPYSIPYDFSPATPSAPRCFDCDVALPLAVSAAGEPRSVDAITRVSCGNAVRGCDGVGCEQGAPRMHWMRSNISQKTNLTTGARYPARRLHVPCI